MTWTFSVIACRCVGKRLETISFVVEGDAHDAWCRPGRCSNAIVQAARRAQRAIALEGAVIEVGVANDQSYTLAMHHGCVLGLGPSLMTTLIERRPMPALSSAAVVLGPSAMLAIGEECMRLGAPRRAPNILVSISDQSPYPPHRSPLGATNLAALLARPACWCRPFAALEGDCSQPLIVMSAHRAESDCATVTVDSLTPLLDSDDTVQWRATLSTGQSCRIHASLRELDNAIVGSVGELAPAVIDDPVSGERFGLAQPIVTSMRLGDVMAREQ
jgi:hypothetical protein